MVKGRLKQKVTILVVGICCWFVAGCQDESRVVLNGFYIPMMVIEEDEDVSEPDNGIEFDANLDRGHGYAVRAAIEQIPEEGSNSAAGCGLLYINSSHRESQFDTEVDSHSIYLECYLRQSITKRLFAEIDLGVGGAGFDFSENNFDSSAGAALLGRISVGYELCDNVDLEAGGGAFMWGYPGETIGHGGFITTGLAIKF